jgi:hypothetical protein
MRTILVSAAALVVGFVLSAVAQNTSTQSTDCGPNAMSPKTSQGVTNSGFTEMQNVPKAIVIHAKDPDGNPVIMLVAPAQ